MKTFPLTPDQAEVVWVLRVHARMTWRDLATFLRRVYPGLNITECRAELEDGFEMVWGDQEDGEALVESAKRVCGRPESDWEGL